MTASAAQNITQYQGVATNRVINAVKNAAHKTGVDFTFLMEKASTESSFNPSAKAKHSSATGLFQFIEQTWLNMVKKHGDKYGLSEYADKIEIKNGKACVDDCDVKNKILALRKNPEISALMAGEFSAENKEFLDKNTKGDVGATELYIAHFMGAGGAAKFLNSREVNPRAVAAHLFPQAAHANKNVFYDKGRPRTLDQIYNLFDKKFTGGDIPPSVTAKAPTSSSVTSSAAAPEASLPLDLDIAARALPSFDDADESDDIIWSDDPRFQRTGDAGRSGFSVGGKNIGGQKLSASSILLLSDVGNYLRPEGRRYNS